MVSIPSRTFLSLSFSLVKKRLSFFVIFSKVPSISCFSMLFNLLILFLIVQKLVSIPPSHLSLTQLDSHLLASCSITFLACFLVPTKRTFFPSETVLERLSAASTRRAWVFFRSIMWIPFFSIKIYGFILGFQRRVK